MMAVTWQQIVMYGVDMNTNLLSAIKLMGQGMLSIFIVMIVITVIVYLFTLMRKDEENESN